MQVVSPEMRHCPMSASERNEKIVPVVWALVALPPPVTGMTLLTEKVVQRLKQSAAIHCIDWSPKNLPRGWRFRVVRGWRVIQSIARLLRAGRVHDGSLYIAANSKAGLWLTIVLAATGRLLGYEIYLHHHTYRYLDRVDRRMTWICNRLRDGVVHVVACPEMEEDFRRVYPAARRFSFVNPSLVTGTIGSPRSAVGQPFVLGHLGNLSHAKGLDLVLKAFRELRLSGANVRLHLAGPFYSRQARQLAAKDLADYPKDIVWFGPVYGADKDKFFAGIDAFLFPTRSESWGIVLNESMAAGVPVIAANRGCVRAVVGDRAGVVVPQDADYVTQAVEQVRIWIDNPAEYAATSTAACQRARSLQLEAKQVLEDFANQLLRNHPPDNEVLKATVV
jgi:glycosyltransferase involved in cell wall biosynthesis